MGSERPITWTSSRRRPGPKCVVLTTLGSRFRGNDGNRIRLFYASSLSARLARSSSKRSTNIHCRTASTA